tara:strand:- start:1332 stop:1502 length:171 start_codon:yes stop_codon:yes gene_type:complete
MIITNAKYSKEYGRNISIICNIDGIHTAVPISEGNRHYDEIKRQVDAGTLTVEAAD